ncbi:EXS C-terminal [Penicillium bovifimosum]|uniref:EXS C-terminal n=1 Tax=Penicillium bovifimosum TaxID=126998 RepID=A0A9W9GHB7_9EURO|nr:EXS C-terminal [Penicillium bovifimosum]KAJ5120403.1 EXS C-terminal [Penicillium bovifimosum]
MAVDQHAQLDTFGLIFPLPLRIAAILVAGFWGWGINLQYLAKANIDVPALVKYPARTNNSQRPHHTAVYRLATCFSIPLALWWLVFWIATHRSPELVERLDWIPQSVYIILLLILIWPFNRASRAGRIRFLLTFKRVLVGGLAETQDGKFGDILLADALTSYAKVIGDLYVSFCMFFTDGLAATSKPNRACGHEIVVPIIMLVPSLIRLRQCLTEYIRARRTATRRETHRGNQHLANALKYASAFPVIWISCKMRNYNPLDFRGYSEVSMVRLLFIVSFINSAYSFWWDVVKDWDMTLFTQQRHHRDHPYGLRRHRYFTSDKIYHYVIIADLALRFSWLWRIIPGLGWVTETESGIWLLMVLEVVRRWMWVFFRTEAEWIRNTHGPGPDDVLLGEYNHKLVAD